MFLNSFYAKIIGNLKSILDENPLWSEVFHLYSSLYLFCMWSFYLNNVRKWIYSFFSSPPPLTHKIINDIKFLVNKNSWWIEIWKFSICITKRNTADDAYDRHLTELNSHNNCYYDYYYYYFRKQSEKLTLAAKDLQIVLLYTKFTMWSIH